MSDAYIYPMITCNLRDGKSFAPDNISNIFAKNGTNAACKPLVKSYNSSMKSGHFPNFWKLARITLYSILAKKAMHIVRGPSHFLLFL